LNSETEIGFYVEFKFNKVFRLVADFKVFFSRLRETP